MTFGERLYELRTKAGISQEQFAELMNVSRQSISKWETDKAYPEMSRLIFMSDYFGVSLDYLVRGKEYEVQDNSYKSVEYNPRRLWDIWNTFYTNLNKSQRAIFCFITVLAVAVLIGLLYALLYGMGYAIGVFLAHFAG